tara:strand:- start:1849 stop:3540 length:1692 start_codon:yes stop_codon:yes gene_type:complete
VFIVAGSGNLHLREQEKALLRVEDLVVNFLSAGGETVQAVSGFSIDVLEGETLGLVGESGCGKSTTARAIIQSPKPTAGSIQLDGVELTELDDEEMRRTRPILQMIFQDPISSLNPRRTIRDAVAEPLYVWWEEETGRLAIASWFEKTGNLFQKIASKFSRPARILAPLAWLSLIFWLVSEASDERSLETWLSWLKTPAQFIGFPVLFILATMAAALSVVGAMWLVLAAILPFGVISGKFGSVTNTVGLTGLFLSLFAAVFLFFRTWSSLGGVAHWLSSGILLLAVGFLAVWSLLACREPSRAGSSAIAVLVFMLFAIQVFYIVGLDENIKLAVFTVSAVVDGILYWLIARRYKLTRAQMRKRAEPEVKRVLEAVGMEAEGSLERKPHEFSGGQAQRISIARALILNPKVVICDEPVSALDVSVQAQILNLLEDMKAAYGLTLVFIAHDLAVVKNISDRVAVMYLGKICEVGPPELLYSAPQHPYTRLLIDAIPRPDPEFDQRNAARIQGELPSPLAPPSGCRFRTRCPNVQAKCSSEEPQMKEVASGHYVACHYPADSELNQ